MKKVFLCLLITTLSNAAFAVDLLEGYIVTASGDTIRCKVKGGKFLTSPFNGISIINNGVEEQVRSKDQSIMAFGFTERGISYHYLYVNVGDKLENGFYQLLVNGTRYKLYTRPTQVYGGNPTYVLFNPAGRFTYFEPCVVCPWKKQLRHLLQDDPTALEKVDNASRVNIPKFVKEINESK